MPKRMKSRRNRHTGRVNAAKRNILDHGAPMRTRSGRVYYRSLEGQMVRDFSKY